MGQNEVKIRVDAVGYLNSVPLVWGMLHGPQSQEVELSFSIPSRCASNIESGLADTGLVPVAEIARQRLETVPGVGIACLGAVRSILLFSRLPWNEVRTLAADHSSRTSVELARIILRDRFGAQPQIIRHEPMLEAMLSQADAALVIGDSALRLNPEALPFNCLDLGSEWFQLTGLPFVFAAWAGKPGIPIERLHRLTTSSYEFGKARLDEIVSSEYRGRGISRELADIYLRRHIRFEIGSPELSGLAAFLELADLSRIPFVQHA